MALFLNVIIMVSAIAVDDVFFHCEAQKRHWVYPLW